MKLTNMLKGDGKAGHLMLALNANEIKDQLADAVGNYHTILENGGNDL